MRKSLMLVLAAGAAAALAGCFDVEQSVSLRRDLSGRAAVHMTIDFEPMMMIMAAMQHSMSGKTGDPTPAEVDEVRRGFLEKRKAEDPAKKRQEQAEQKAQLERSLPPGVRLVSSSVEDQGTKMVARFEFEYDDVRKLSQLKLPEKGGQAQPGQNPFADPFASLKVVDEGPTLLVTMGGGDPAARLRQEAQKDPGAGANPEMAKAFEGAFKNARLAFKLDSPFDVVDTNATRREGRSLYWEIRASDPNAKMLQVLTARLKK
jgi:hypothetical protein